MRHLALAEVRRRRPGPANNRLDLTGLRIGRLLVLLPIEIDQHRNIIWLCSCECGEPARVSARNLRRGKTKSCGCLRAEKNPKHGFKLRLVQGGAS